MTMIAEQAEGVATGLQCYSFTLILSGIDDITQKVQDTLYDAGCGDALLGIRAGTPYMAFDREADSLEDALRSAIHDVEDCGLGIEVVKVIPPQEEIIEMINKFLRARRVVVHELSSELRKKLDQIIHQSMREHGELE